MRPSSVKARLLAVSLLIFSSCGTFAIFGAVPLMARLLSAQLPSPQQQSEVFPQPSQPSSPDRPLVTTIPAQKRQAQQKQLVSPTASNRLQPNRSAL